MTSQNIPIKIVMFPWLAHGHITPFLELAKALSEKNFHCYIISTPANHTSVKNKIPEKYSSTTIHLVDLLLPTSPDLPPHYHTTNGLPIQLHPTLRKLLRAAKPDFSNLVRSLQPDLIIHDIMQPWARSVASQHNIPSVSFFTSGAVPFSYFSHLGKHPGDKFPFPAIQLDEFERSMLLGHMESFKTEEKDPEDEVFGGEDGIMLMNTTREMEGKYIDYASQMINKEILPVGGFLTRDPSTRVDEMADDLEIVDWLNSKDERSTVFVSFGSEYFLREDQMEEVACGLELSGANFIWVVRFPKGDSTGTEQALPEGFLRRVGGRGKIVEGWSPQEAILRHPSVGGFVSHCGWNSLKESIDRGVPIIAVPVHLDQPLNAKLVAELGVGVEVKRGDEGRLKGEEISRVIRDVLAAGGNGEELRRRVLEQREKIRLTSRNEVEEVARRLFKICGVKL